MNKAEKLIKQHPILRIVLLILIMIEILKILYLYGFYLLTMDITCEEMTALGLIILNVCLTAAILITYYNQCTSLKTYWFNV